MTSRVYLHIGGEKTGTTSLQVFLARNAKHLDKQGFSYPSERDCVFFDHNVAHFPIAACLLRGAAEFVSEEKSRTLPLVLGALKRTIRRSGQITILSCEHFS